MRGRGPTDSGRKICPTVLAVQGDKYVRESLMFSNYECEYD